MKVRVMRTDAEAAIRKIVAAGYRMPQDTDMDRLAGLWEHVLVGLEPQELRDGVDDFLREGGRFFPRPGEMRKFALATRSSRDGPRDLEGRYYRWEQNHEGPCPVCQATLREIRRNGEEVGRWGVEHDPDEHQRKGVPAFGVPERPQTHQQATTEGGAK